MTDRPSSINEPTLKGNCRDRDRGQGVLRRRRPPHPLSQSVGGSAAGRGRGVVHPVIIEPLEELTNDLRHADQETETTRNAGRLIAVTPTVARPSVTSISGLRSRRWREISPFIMKTKTPPPPPPHSNHRGSCKIGKAKNGCISLRFFFRLLYRALTSVRPFVTWSYCYQPRLPLICGFNLTTWGQEGREGEGTDTDKFTGETRL